MLPMVTGKAVITGFILCIVPFMWVKYIVSTDIWDNITKLLLKYNQHRICSLKSLTYQRFSFNGCCIMIAGNLHWVFPQFHALVIFCTWNCWEFQSNCQVHLWLRFVLLHMCTINVTVLNLYATQFNFKTKNVQNTV